MKVFFSMIALLCAATLLVLQIGPATLETLMIASGLFGSVLGVFLGAAAIEVDWALRARRDRRSDQTAADSAP